jgi:putative phosphoesterase
MKLLFFSDVHGNAASLKRLMEHIEQLNPQQLILLGDALYHGPRNPIQQTYAPADAVPLLNSLKATIIAVRGNCDSEVDQMLLEFPLMGDYTTLLVDGLRIFATHGHIWNPAHLLPMANCNLFAYGHTHIPQLARHPDGAILLNPGSISLPKNGNPPSFAFFDNGRIQLLRLTDGAIMDELVC